MKEASPEKMAALCKAEEWEEFRHDKDFTKPDDFSVG
ncbi:hypothetical protein J3R74_004095 [Puniceicoccus vermicola]